MRLNTLFAETGSAERTGLDFHNCPAALSRFGVRTVNGKDPGDISGASLLHIPPP